MMPSHHLWDVKNETLPSLHIPLRTVCASFVVGFHLRRPSGARYIDYLEETVVRCEKMNLRVAKFAVCTVAFLGVAALEGTALAQDEHDARMLHVLIIGDTDADIGESVAEDVHNIRRHMFAGVPGHRRRIETLIGKNANRAFILRTVSSLPVRPTDTLFCYYAGHGRITRRRHQLDLTHRPVLVRETLLAAMRNKGARLTVLITDCCAFDVPPQEGLAACLQPRFGNPEVIRHLFFRHHGVVDINSAQQGQLAWQLQVGETDLGGIFTNAFCSLLNGSVPSIDRNTDRQVDWQECFGKVKLATEQGFLEFKNTCNNTPNLQGDCTLSHCPNRTCCR